MSSEHALTDADRALLSQKADAFYSAARTRSPENWEEYLEEVPVRLRPAVLTELVIIDLVQHWKRGKRKLIEEYVSRFPELGPLDRVSPKLIAEEYRARLKAGEPRDVDQYRRRFPVQFVGLEEELLGIENESSLRGKSGQFAAVKTVSGTDTAPSGRTPASGTIRGTESVRPSGVIASALRSRTADYTRLKKLGAGQFGEVWLVESKTTQIKKALKVMLRPADDETGVRELRSLDLIKNEKHPYLLQTEDYWVDDNKLYVLMELADGTLRNWLAQLNPGLESREYRKGLPPGELLHVLREAAEVMDELHAKQVMHRDIKPDNILLKSGHAKVADFGLARHQDPGVATQSMMAGSPAYMAPEVWAGKFGAASDLYSLAVTYAELRQGKLPVKLGPMAEIMFAHLEGQFEFSPVFSKAEVAVVRKALAKEPRERYESCSEFVHELVKVVNVPLALPGFKVAGGTQHRLQPLPPIPNENEAKETAGWEPNRTTSATETGPTKKQGWGATQTHVPNHLLTGGRPKPKPQRKTNWVGIGVAGGVILGILALIAFLVLGPKPQPTASGDEPTTSSGGGGGQTGGGGEPTTKPVPTTPVADPVRPPLGTIAVGDKTVKLSTGRLVPVWVTKTVGGEVMRFRVIEPVVADGTKPFYISERKVSVKAYGKGRDETVPVTDVTAAEAARWAADAFPEAEGRLPTPKEWDHACGFHDPKRGATIWSTGGEPWVDKKEPSPARFGPTADKNLYDLFDMAGNGREWTCGVLMKSGPPPEIDPKTDGKFGDFDKVILRGRNYTLLGGLTFDELKRERDTEPQTQLAGKPSPYTGFRVVLPLLD